LNRLALPIALIVLTIAGLAIDAFVHFNLAPTFDPVKTSSVSEGDLFRLEGALAVLAALGVAVRPRRYTAAFAFLVAAGGVFAVLLYQYVDVGKLGPLPDMYDPVWSSKKALSLVGEALAALTALGLFALVHVRAPKEDRTQAAAPVATR
jgi:hypothetical protein